MIVNEVTDRYPDQFPYSIRDASEDDICMQLGIYAASDYYPIYVGKYGITMKKSADISEVPIIYRHLYYGEADPGIDIYELFKMEK